MRIPDGSSVFTAEAKSIDLALDFVNNGTYTEKNRYFLLFIVSSTGFKTHIIKEFTNSTSFVKAS